MKSEVIALIVDRRRLLDFLALTKPRLNSLVVATTGVGYFLGANAPFELFVGIHVLIGSALVAGGAAALNQISERDIDEIMSRTRQRPMPTGRITATEGRLFASVISAIGLVELALGANIIAAAVAAVTLVIYVTVYTPLKRRSPWATIVGAVPGALPTVIGWTAARSALTVEAWVLFSIVFLWQLPHFHALSWLYRNDFRRAGLPLIAVQDTDGRRTGRHMVFFAAILVPVSLAPSIVGLAGTSHLIIATCLSTGFLLLAVRFLVVRTEARARALFVGSLIYLPLLWGSLIVARLW